MEFVGAEEKLSSQSENIIESETMIGDESSAIKEDAVVIDEQPKKPLSKRGRPSLKEIDINFF